MPYVLGVDLGNSRTAAATCRLDGPPWGEADMVRLGMRSDPTASTVYLAPDGSVVVGDAAERHAPAEPGSVARGFLRRMGDDTPLVVGGEPCTPQDLAAALVLWVVERAAAARGGPAQHVVVTHPPGWGPYRRMLLHQALRHAGLTTVTLLPEPIAVGEGHVARHQVDAGSALAVYSLGATAFSSSVVKRTDISTFDLIGHADGTERLGGAHFDDLLLATVRAKLNRALADLDPADPASWSTLARLRQECAEAKHRLSVDAETGVRVPPPAQPVRLTRTEFEQLVRPAVEATVDILRRTVRRSGVEELEAVLLVGESTRIPLVTELIAAKMPDPDLVVAPPAAVGAALAARRLVTGGTAGGPAPDAASRSGDLLTVDAPGHSATERTAVVIAVEDDPEDDEEPPPRPSIEITPPELPERRSPLRLFSGTKQSVAGVVAIVVIAGGVWLTFALQGGSSPAPGTGPPATPAAASSQQPGPSHPASHRPTSSSEPSPNQHDGQDKDGR